MGRGHVYIVVVVHRNAGPIKIVILAVAVYIAPLGQIVAVAIELLNAEVDVISNINIVAAVYRNVPGTLKLAVAAARSAPFRQILAKGGKLENANVVDIGNVNIVAGVQRQIFRDKRASGHRRGINLKQICRRIIRAQRRNHGQQAGHQEQGRQTTGPRPRRRLSRTVQVIHKVVFLVQFRLARMRC